MQIQILVAVLEYVGEVWNRIIMANGILKFSGFIYRSSISIIIGLEKLEMYELLLPWKDTLYMLTLFT